MVIKMNTFQLECFLAVANTLSFARAAEQMNITQPAISHQIKSLEEELNTKLFKRSTRFVELTLDGSNFVNDAKGIVESCIQAKMKLNSQKANPINSISIGLNNYNQLESIKNILSNLNKDIANLHPRIILKPISRLFQMLENERLDVFFSFCEESELKDNIKYKEIISDELVCICNNNNPLAQKKSISLDELKNEKIVFCDPLYLPNQISKLQFKLLEGKNPLNSIYSSSYEASIFLVELNLGIAIIPNILVPNNKNILKIKINDNIKLSYGMFYNKDNINKATKQIIKLI